jgi:hypothetical protein
VATKKTNKTTKNTTDERQIPISSAVTERFERIGPEQAKQYLATNTNNRQVVQSYVDRYAITMKSGLWRRTHMGIAFGADGTLYDGQHRLLAIIKANVEIELMVTRGLTREALDAIDTGGPRKPHDVLAIADGIKLNRRQRASILAAYWLILHGELKWTRTGADVHDLRVAVADHKENVFAILEVLSKQRDSLSGSAALVGSLAIARKTQPEKVDEFVSLLRSGALLTEGHPALVLRNHIGFRSATAATGGSDARDDISLRTFAAFDAFVRGESRSQLKRSETARKQYIAAWGKSRAR